MLSRKFPPFALALVFVGCLGAGSWLFGPVQDSDQALLLENARILDPASQSVQNGHLLIRDGRIESVLENAPGGFQGQRIDLEGKWVIPGLADMHTHSFGNASPAASGGGQFLGTAGTAKRMLYAGVTAFLDLFSPEDAILGLRQQQREGKVPGADIFCAGPCITADQGHCTEYGVPTRTINTPEEAREQIAQLAAKKPDVIKLVYDNVPGRMPTIDRATLQAAIQGAKERGIKTVIHVGTWQDVQDAAEAGANAVTHIPRGEVPQGLVELLRQREVTSIPTLTVHCDLAKFTESPRLLENPLLRSVVSQQVLDSYQDAKSQSGRASGWAKAQKARCQGILKSAAELARGGVRILTGTDAGNLGVFQGYSVHREMILLVEAGLTPWQALAAATSNASDFLGQPWGVRPGDAANLVVLSASPLEDIANTQRIEQVIQRGRLVDRQALLR